MTVEKNKQRWNESAAVWAAWNHSPKVLNPVLEDPWKAFHSGVKELLQRCVPDFSGRKICVPSSGDNLAVFAFALMGAKVTSCDISENQLANAEKVAAKAGLDIEFICTDTRTLAGLPDGAFDLVYTSNGVHVWIDDLPAMYQNIFRVLKPGGLNLSFELHPFRRPFGEGMKVVKPYDCVGPFEGDSDITFAWRVQDLLNAVMGSGLRLLEVAELFAEKNYDNPFFLSTKQLAEGVTLPREEVDRLYDWRQNPEMALPAWLVWAARK